MRKFLFIIFLIPIFLSAIEIDRLSDDEIESLISRLQTEPIDINNADFNTLYELPFLDYALCEKILDFRREGSGFKNLQEFAIFINIEADYFKIIKNCISVSKPTKLESHLVIQERLRQEFPTPEAIADSSWLGTSPFYQQNIQFVHKDSEKSVSARFMTRKESGELAAGTNFKYNFEYIDKNYNLVAGSFSYKTLTGFGIQTGFSGSNSLSPRLKIEKSFKTSTGSSRTDLQGAACAVSFDSTFSTTVFYGETYLPAQKDSDGVIYRINYTKFNRTPKDFTNYWQTAYILSGTEFQYLLDQTQFRVNILLQKFKDRVTSDLELPSQYASEISIKHRWNNQLYTGINTILMDKTNPSFELGNYYKFGQSVTELSYIYIGESNYLLPASNLLASGVAYEQSLNLAITDRSSNRIIAFTSKVGLRKYTISPAKDYLVSNIILNTEQKSGKFLFGLKLKNAVSYQCYSTGIKKENVSTYQVKSGWITDSLTMITNLIFMNSNQDNRPYGYIFGQSVDSQLGDYWSLKLGGDLYYSQTEITLTQARTDVSTIVNTRYFSGQGHDFFVRGGFDYAGFKAQAGAMVYKSEIINDSGYRVLFQADLQISL